MECLDSIYGCVLVHGCVAVATEGWWSLDPVERKLLTIAITTESICTTRDIPVFLPRKSPNVSIVEQTLDTEKKHFKRKFQTILEKNFRKNFRLAKFFFRRQKKT